ncbi:MAG: 16S rRNA (cytosine(967)-C(5))-methyltransferase RsmB [Clostridiales bacterium]|nr:16S rRNA (cytosine(967)-C(5))-methyltransferase RsmB [Clostridiales bacterium]
MEKKPQRKGPFGSKKPGGRPAYGAQNASRGKKTFEKTGSRPPQSGRLPVRREAKPARDPNAPSSLSRKVALEIFEDVIRNDAYASLSLEEKLRSTSLSQLDKRFCASIVYRTLENLIRIDYVLGFFLQDAEKLEPKVRDILRISACQLLFHDRIPENAVVDEAVRLTRNQGLEGLTGLTNAVLRSLIRGRDSIRWPGKEEGARYLSILYSVPQWLAEKLIGAYGAEEAEKICAFRNESHYTVIRPNLMRFSDEEFEKLLEGKVWEVEKGLVPHAYRVRKASDIGRDADYLRGNFSIQGEGSMLSAQAVDGKRGMQVIDCCAAPGGKMAYLAEAMQGTGRVYALDLHEHRVLLIQSQMRRLKLDNVRPMVRDAAQVREEWIGTADAVLLDAPCSGLGVMDNKPDIKIRMTEAAVRELAALQEKLLDACCQYVKKGGTLVYSTCSLLPEENGEQIRGFLDRHPGFALDRLPESFDERFRERHQSDGGLQLLPHRDQMEGFFIARMRRVK